MNAGTTDSQAVVGEQARRWWVEALKLGSLLTVLASLTVLVAAPRYSASNVVLIVLDAAGARHFGVYGNALPTSPSIDAFARDATVFERAYSQAPATLRSMCSLMTGKYAQSGSYTPQQFKMGEVDTIPIALAAAGLRTGAFVQNPWISRVFGFAHGFGVFRMYDANSGAAEDSLTAAEIPRTRIVRDALRWVDSVRDERFFLYVHLIAPHSPYTPPAPFAGSFDPDNDGVARDLDGLWLKIELGELELSALSAEEVAHLRLAYQENLAFADDQAGALLRHLQREGLFDNSVVVVTADHGEAFLEHGRLAHGTTVYDEMIHVPLLIHWPRSLGELPKRWPGPVELRRLFPTFVDALDMPGDPAADSLLPMLRSSDSGAFGVDGLARSEISEPLQKTNVRTMIRGASKLIVSDIGEIELYDVEKDPGERHNLAAENSDLVEALRALLDRERVEIPAADVPEIDESTREKLRALGYQVD